MFAIGFHCEHAICVKFAFFKEISVYDNRC